MDLFWNCIEQLLDFNKVRKFQEVCGLTSNNQNNNIKINKNNLCQNDNHAPTFTNGKYCKDDSIHSQEHPHVKNYTVNNWFLYYLFRFGSFLGTEMFYITFIPVVFWNFDPYVGRKLVVVWVVTMYIGQVLKDLICWPRPSWPPVFKLETRVQAEYGIPSTHAIAGTSIPFSIVMAMHGRYLMTYHTGLLIALGFCLLVSLSRLYVGMHSILDIVAGVLISALYLVFGFPFMDLVEDYTIKTSYAPLIIIISHFLLGYFYPTTNHYNTSRGDTVIILAVGAGIHSASWLLNRLDISFAPFEEPPFVLPVPTTDSMMIGVGRFIVGFVVIAATRTIVKFLAVSAVCHLAGVNKHDRSVLQSKTIEVTYKFITYFFTGFNVVVTAPLILQALNIVY